MMGAKTVVVTGASSGIGLATSLQLAEMGARVANEPGIPLGQIEARQLRYVVAVPEDLHLDRAASGLQALPSSPRATSFAGIVWVTGGFFTSMPGCVAGPGAHSCPRKGRDLEKPNVRSESRHGR